MSNTSHDPIQAYADCDYARCIEILLEQMQQGPNPFLVSQIFLTSLQRTGVAGGESFARRLVEASQGDPLIGGLLRLTIGEVAFAEVEPLATTDEERAALHFCQATRLYTLGDDTRARAHFREVFGGGESSTLAQLARIEHNATWRRPNPSISAEIAGLLDKARGFGRAGRYHDALAAAKDALEGARRSGARVAVADSLDATGVYNRALGRLGEAEAALRECLAIRRAELGEGHPAVAQALDHLGAVRFAAGAAGEAEALCTEALQIAEQCLGQADWQVVETLRGLARIKTALGRYPEAEGLYRRAAGVLARLGQQGSDECAEVLEHVGEVCRQAGRWGDATQAFREAIAIYEARPDPRTAAYGRVRSSLAIMLAQAGEVGEAERLAREAVADLQQADPGGEELAASLLRLGSVLACKGDHVGAEGAYTEVARMPLGDSPGALQLRAQALGGLAESRERRGEHASAAELFDEALGLVARGGREAEAALAAASLRFGEACLDNDQADRAAPYLERALAMRRAREDVSAEDLATAVMALARLRWVQVRLDESLELCHEAVALEERHRADRPERLAAALCNLAILHRHRKELREAAEAYDRSLAILREVGKEGTRIYMNVLINAGFHLMMAGEYPEAEAWLREALRIAEYVAEKDSPEYARAFARLGDLLILAGRDEEAERHLGSRVILRVAGVRSQQYSDVARLALARGDVEGIMAAAKRAGETDGRLNPLDRERRQVRLFVSSTFRDMQAERDMLVGRVFRRARDLCRERGIVLTEVDLRWGITEEQARREGAVRLCLDEVDRCDYFLGLLGDRYGYVPAEISSGLLAVHPWLAEYRDRSITELELVRGALQPHGVKKARVYLREPTATPPDQSPEDTARLAALKQRLRDSKVVCNPYANPEDLDDLVWRDLQEMLDGDFPPSEGFDRYRVEGASQQHFLTHEAELVAGREAEDLALDDWVDGHGRVTLLTGEPGSGKTALLCRWAARSGEGGPWRFFHSTEVGRDSTDWEFAARRLLAALKGEFGIDEPIPVNSADVPPTVRDWVARSARMRPLVLAFDGADRFAAHDWLPTAEDLPVHLVLSCRPGRCREQLAGLAPREIALGPLTDCERCDVAARFLSRYGKVLPEVALESVARSSAAGNPLYLRLLLEELRVFGHHEALAAKVAECLSARTVADLFELTMVRLEGECDRDHPGLVRDCFSLLACCPAGLPEGELLTLLGADGSPLPYLYWSQLLNSAEFALHATRDRVRLVNDAVREAAGRRYLGPDRLPAVVRRLIDWVAAQLDVTRQFEELPELYKRIGDWAGLAEALARPALMEHGMSEARGMCVALWAEVRRASPRSFESAFASVAADPGPFPLEYVSTVALLLGDLGLTEPVTRLREHCVDRERARGRTVNLAITLQNLAEAYRTAGETERALRAGREAGKIYHDLGDAEGEATLLFNEAFCLARLGQRGEAWAVLDRMKALSREAGSDRALGMCLNLRGRMRCHATPEDRTAAENDMRAAEGIARAQGDTGALATSLFGQGMIRLYERDLSGARERYAEALRLFRSIGRDGEADHAATRLELVERFASRPRVASAIGGDELWHPFYTAVLLEEGETAVAVLDSIDAEGDRRGELQLQAAALVHRAALARLVHEAGWRKFLGPAVQILSRYEESEAIELMRAVGTSLLTRCAASEVALAFFAEVERSARAHRRRRELAQALLEQGVILANEGNLAAALKKFEEQGRIARKAENWESLAHALNNQAAVLEQLGRPALSVGRLRELLPVLRRLGDGDRINEVSRVLAMISQHYRL